MSQHRFHLGVDTGGTFTDFVCLDKETGELRIHKVLSTPEAPEHKPDGAVIDAEGCLWSAQWGSARVARYSPEGHFLSAIDLLTGHTSCPAFGDPDLKTLYVTTALQKLPEEAFNLYSKHLSKTN